MCFSEWGRANTPIIKLPPPPPPIQRACNRLVSPVLLFNEDFAGFGLGKMDFGEEPKTRENNFLFG